MRSSSYWYWYIDIVKHYAIGHGWSQNSDLRRSSDYIEICLWTKLVGTERELLINDANEWAKAAKMPNFRPNHKPNSHGRAPEFQGAHASIDIWKKKNHSNKVFPALEHRPNHCSNWVPSVFRPNQKGLTFYQPQTLVTGTSPKYWLATSKSRSPRFARARAFLAFFLPVQVASSRGLQVWMGQKPFNRFSVGVCWQ